MSFSSGMPHIAQDTPLSGLPRTRSISGDLTETCACISNQAIFLSSLKKMEGKYSPAPVPVILQATQDSRVLWERLMYCSACRRDRDSVAVLMFAMGLRKILRGLQCLILNQQSSQHSIHSSNINQHTSHGSTTSGFRDHTAGQINGGGHRHSSFEGINLGPIRPPSSSSFADKIRVGSFEIPQEEQAFLTDVLIARALTKMKSFLESMAGYVERVSDMSLHSIEHSEKWPVHFVLEDLQRSIFDTEKSVREIIRR
ncbi:uncharacterized protein N7483_011808 [Penicillium malachiteum]|uniref:uncharacterized protein n=1 Tax=Penicillium malachiteum TaxID=1324776 RepID=UPI0025493F83|nr:uncharacterized protein N7483_011808 [Penicillium malachiteum]KAJ5714627.1 hypothetical protein N7483_011808 [Penicillium malachiteum]